MFQRSLREPPNRDQVHLDRMSKLMKTDYFERLLVTHLGLFNKMIDQDYYFYHWEMINALGLCYEKNNSRNPDLEI